jgi:hypothetical protein
MFIGHGSSIVGVCVVYGLNYFVHPFYCLYKPLIDEKDGDIQKKKTDKEEIYRKKDRQGGDI